MFSRGLCCCFGGSISELWVDVRGWMFFTCALRLLRHILRQGFGP